MDGDRSSSGNLKSELHFSLAMSKFGMGLEEAKDCSSLADTNS